jgi:hypothetical protein
MSVAFSYGPYGADTPVRRLLTLIFAGHRAWVPAFALRSKNLAGNALSDLPHHLGIFFCQSYIVRILPFAALRISAAGSRCAHAC